MANLCPVFWTFYIRFFFFLVVVSKMFFINLSAFVYVFVMDLYKYMWT